MFDGNPPEVAEAERKRLRVFHRNVMEVVTVFGQKFAEAVVVLAAEKLQEPGAGFGDIDSTLCFIVAQAFSRRSLITAKPGIRFDRRAIGVERIDVRGYDG